MTSASHTGSLCASEPFPAYLLNGSALPAARGVGALLASDLLSVECVGQS